MPHIGRMGTDMLEELNLKKQKCIAYVGAGGKTSALYTCVKERLKEGQMAVALTTTKMWEPEKNFVEWKEGFCYLQLKEFVLHRRPEPVTFGIRLENGKIGPVPYEVMRNLIHEGCSLFIEADGAKGKWIKKPNEDEPVVPEFCEVVIGILNQRAIGLPFDKVAHRPQECADFMKKNVKDLVEIQDLCRLWTEKEGIFKNFPNLKRAVLSGFLIGEGQKFYEMYKDVFQQMKESEMPVFLWERSNDGQRVISTDKRTV